MKKVLVVRFSSIGDIVLTTPVIRGLHQQLGVEVHFLTKRSFAGVLSANPYLQQVWSIEREITEVTTALQAERFDAIVDLHHNLRSRRLSWSLRGVPVYRFDKLNWEKWLLTQWKINRMPDVHIVDRYLAAAAPLGIKNDGQGLDHFVPEEDRVVPASLGLTSPFVAVVIGAAHATKRLPPARLIDLARQLEYPVALLGGPGDKEVTDQIVAAQVGQVHNFCGVLRLHQSADLLRQSACVVTHDTGLMHMAAAFRKPIVSIWGNTVPEFGMYPYNPDSRVLNHQFQVADLSCRPCSKIGHASCPKQHFDCMQKQDVGRIAEVVNGILRNIA